MKTILRKLFFIGVLAPVFSACDMEVVPPAEISAENFWKTDKDAWYALNTCYLQMRALDIWDEMCTDNAHSHKPWEGNFEFVQQNGISDANGYGDYSFDKIRAVNDFLDKVEGCDMDETIKNRMKAEARFFRAFSYLDLTQYFGKVPIIEGLMTYDAPNVPRNSVEEVRAYILKELDEVAQILPESYKGGYLNETGRVTKYGALALRARAALYFGNYAEAEKSAKAVMDSRKYSLFRKTELNDGERQEADEMDLYIDFAALGIDKEKFINGMFSYGGLWQGKNATVSNPEFVLTHEYMDDANASHNDTYYNQANRYTYFIPIDMTIWQGYSSFEPMQDLVDAYWEIDGKTLPEQIDTATRKANYNAIWQDAKDLNAADYKAFSTDPKLMDYAYMQEFRNRDSRLYASLMFPFKGWHSSPKGEHYYRWDQAQVGGNGNISWTGYSYRKMVSTEPYNRFNSTEDYPTIRYAEVLLTFAEAHLMTTGWDQPVRDALNDIRDRCGMPDVPAAMSKDEAIDFLRNERRIELAVEGHRYDDVRRYGSAYCQKYLNGPTFAPNGYLVINKVWDDRMMLMPIPVGAMDVNPLLKDDQNPGY